MFGFEGLLTGVIQEPTLILFFGLFFLFILVAYKVVKMLIRALVIAVHSGLFTVIGNLFFGMNIQVTIDNIIWFAMTGVEIYFVYHIIVDIGKLAEIFMKPFRRGKVKKVEKVIIMERDKHEKKD